VAQLHIHLLVQSKGKDQNYWLNHVRRRREAKDSGKTEQQVSQLVAQLFQMRARMQNMMGCHARKRLPTWTNTNSMESIKAEEQGAADTGRRRRKYGNLRQRQVDATMRGFRRH